jgi:hypothetical protein
LQRVRATDVGADAFTHGTALHAARARFFVSSFLPRAIPPQSTHTYPVRNIAPVAQATTSIAHHPSTATTRLRTIPYHVVHDHDHDRPHEYLRTRSRSPSSSSPPPRHLTPASCAQIQTAPCKHTSRPSSPGCCTRSARAATSRAARTGRRAPCRRTQGAERARVSRGRSV